MKVLAIDRGNSRLKFAVSGDGAEGSQSLPFVDEAEALGVSWKQVRTARGEPDCIVISNVAGERAGKVLAQSLRVFAAEPRWLISAARQCGVTNRYDNPTQLGSDRWAALIGAWARVHGACLVVNAGTATTVDALSAEGEFLGGLIVPGFSMMREALSSGTAALPLTDGHAAEFPRNTADAIWNGCLAAQAGAIERMGKKLPASAACLLSGGAAGILRPALNMPASVVDNLVLEGLMHIAREP
jgi:type III pantothenate kinase